MSDTLGSDEARKNIMVKNELNKMEAFQDFDSRTAIECYLSPQDCASSSCSIANL